MKPVNSFDKTNFLQSLMHMIKGNFGTGILAMPASFNHCGLINALIGLPVLCLIATYCVHLLVRSSQHLENKMKCNSSSSLEYAELAKGAFVTGPKWMRPFSGSMCLLVDLVQILCQLGICCVYLVFIVDNFKMILDTLKMPVTKHYLYLIILPIALLLSYIRTLKRLAIASACANILQIAGISIVIEYILRDTQHKAEIEYFKPFSQVALGFGSAMFAFEGIAVVMPIYSRMKRQQQMGGLLGVINLSFAILLALYMVIGLFGYLRFGSQAAGSITLNLPREPLYELVRAAFTISICLTYPLQFYVLNEVIWSWICGRYLLPKSRQDGSKKPIQIDAVTTPTTATIASLTSDTNNNINTNINNQSAQSEMTTKNGPQMVWGEDFQRKYSFYEYLCRTGLVLFTFALAISVPKLNLMMDFFGSISGTSLSITLPPLVHIAAFWEDTSGRSRWILAILDGGIILFGILASANGSYFSLMQILASFDVSNANAIGTSNH